MKIFIGCSSMGDIPNKYLGDCKNLLEKIIPNNELVFGARDTGLMGMAYDIAYQKNCFITGICPDAYKEDFLRLNCSKEITTKSVSQRTETLINNSDVLVFLPGGIGTIFELFSAIESKRCKEFDKPIIIYNSSGFYDELLLFMEKLYKEKFCNSGDKNNYFLSDCPDEIISFLNKYENDEIKNLIKINTKII